MIELVGVQMLVTWERNGPRSEPVGDGKISDRVSQARQGWLPVNWDRIMDFGGNSLFETKIQ